MTTPPLPAFVRPWLSRENVAAVSAIALGTAGGLAGGVLSMLGEGNYQAHSFLGGFAGAIVAAGALFTVGAYAGAVIPWALDDRERDFSPALACLGAIGGGTLSAALLLVPITTLGGPLGMALGAIGGQPLTLLGTLAGARLSMRLKWRKPRQAALRWVRLVLAGLLGLGAIIYAAWPHHTFPGAQAPLSARRAWAVSTFGADYEAVEAHVKGAEAVRDRLGPLTALAPTEGPNHTDQTPGERVGVFTLDLVGPKGHGTVEVSFVRASDASLSFKGTLTLDGKAIPFAD